VVVDALLGTGLTRDVEGAAADAIAWILAARERGARVVAVELPSGLDADTGQPHGPTVAADATVTCGLPKLGLVLEPGRELAGRVLIARIGIVDRAPDAAPEAFLVTRALAAAWLPLRPRSGHKGRFGHALVVAGSQGKAGAAALAARGALRVGAGLVTVACPAPESAALQAGLPEAMTAPLACNAAGGLAEHALGDVLALASERDVVAIGPGLGSAPETVALIRALVGRCERPLVIDADGLNALAAQPTLLKAREAASILTPHPGEAARFLGVTAADVNRDRVGAARSIVERSRSVVALKGAATVIASPDARVAVNPTGGAALGTGGTGDVLCGVVAGLVAQGLGTFEAAVIGVYFHGLAGDRWQAVHGDAGLRASELADGIPGALRAVREGHGEQGDDERSRAGRAGQHDRGALGGGGLLRILGP
jgi:NAD(P)H-hydrate epimerase